MGSVSAIAALLTSPTRGALFVLEPFIVGCLKPVGGKGYKKFKLISC